MATVQCFVVKDFPKDKLGVGLFRMCTVSKLHMPLAEQTIIHLDRWTHHGYLGQQSSI